MAAHDLINAAVKANESAMRTAIKNGYPVQLPANQYLPKAMNGNVDIIHLGQFADLDAGFDEYRKQQAAQQAQAASQDFSDLDAGFAEWSAGQGGPNVESMRISPVEAPKTASTSTGGQSTGSRSTRANTGAGTAQEEIPSLDNMAVPVTAKAATKTVTKAEKTAAKEVKQANSTLSKADKALQTAQKKQTVAENNLRKKLDKSEAEAQKADALQGAAKVTKKGNTTVIEPAQNVQQTKRKMQNLAREEARAQAEYTKAQEDVRKAEERAKKAADKQAAANDRAQAVSAFAARRTANSGTVSSAEQVTNNAVRRDIIDQAVNNQISSYNAMPKASAVRGTSGRASTGSGRGFVPDESPVVQELIPTLDASVQNLVPTLDVNERIQQRQAEAREATSGKPVASTSTTTPEMDLMQSAVRADALRPQSESSRRLSYLSYLSDPNRRLTKEEQAEAEQIIRDYNREHGIHGGIEGWYDGPNDPQSPEYQEYAAVQRLKAKTTGGAIGSGISDAYNLFNGLLPEGAAKLADFVTGDPNNSFSQSIRQANDLRDQTMQASQTQAPLAYAGGNMAGKMSQYMATNGLFDSIATGKLGLEAGSEAAFWANQLAQNAQDWAISEIPDYIQNRQNGMSREEALRNFGREALIDAGGNVTMGALGDYVIPGLINRFGKGSFEATPDDIMERAVSNTPAPVDDSVDAALFGTGMMQDLRGADIPVLKEADDYILGGVGRQADDVADAAKAAEPVAPVTDAVEEAVDEIPSVQSIAEDTGIPEQADEVLNVGADEIPSATRQAAEATPATAPESIPELVDDSEVEPPENWQALFDEPAPAKSAEEASSDIPILADNADEVADTANHANRSNNVTMTEEELDEAIADVPPLGPKVDPVDRVLDKVGKQDWKSREYIGKTRTNSIQNSGIDDLAEQADVIPESLFKHSSIPEKQTMHNAYLKVELEQQAQIDRFAKRMTSEELGQLGSEDVDTMFILRNTLNKQAREATDEATKAELYRLSREVALNIDQVGHSRGQTLQSFRKWAHTYDGAVATAEGRLYKTVDDQLRANPKMQAEIDSVAHQIFDKIGEIDSLDDAQKQVHDIVRQAMEDSRYLKGKVDDATVTKLTDSILKEKSFEGIQEQLDFLATGHEHLSMDTLDKVQRLFDEAAEFDYGSKDYYQREMQAYALLANDMFPKGSTFRSKFDQWRYFAMLANPTTHIKNMTGNVLFGQGAVSAKNNLAAVIEASADRVSKATGGKGIDRTKSILNAFSKKDKGLLEAARQDAFDKSYRALTGTGRYLDPARGIDQATPTWSTKSRLGRALNAATGLNNRLLSGEDEVAMIAKYQTSLAGYLKANGYDANIFKATDDESLKVLESARAYALRQAEEAAFHQNSNLAKQMTQFTQNLRNSDKLIDRAVGTAADIAIPFKKTPINILKSCFAYSPLEFAKVAAEIPDLYKGAIKPADFIDDLSKGLTGTAGLVIGALLAHGGVIEAGSSEGDKEAAFDKTAGRQNNAVKIGGKQIGLAELVPAAAPIIFGAIMYETKRESEKNGNAALDTIVNGAMGLTDAVTDMTMLSGIADIIADAKSAQSKGETFTNIAGGLAENLVGQMLPTVGRKAEITVDDTKRSTYSDRSGTMKQLDSSAKYWQTKIPGSQALGEKLEQSEIPMLQSVGSRLTLEPAVDAWGREIKQTGGNLGGRAAYNFLSPVTISSESQDPTDQELYALSDQTGSDDVFHQMPQTDSKFKVDGEDVKLSESQWTEYQKRNGTMAKELVDAFINSDLYAAMSDDDKVEMLKGIYSYTKDAAQHEVGGKTMNSTNANIYAAYQEGGAEAVIDYLTMKNTANAYGLEADDKSKELYDKYGEEGLEKTVDYTNQFDEIKQGRKDSGKTDNINIMSALELLNANQEDGQLILDGVAKSKQLNPEKFEQLQDGSWVYHQGDKILTADEVAEPTVEEPVAEPVPEAEAEPSEPFLSGVNLPEQPQQSQAKAVSQAQRQQRAELRATQQPEAEEIPVLEEQPKPVQQTANVEINPATGRPVAPTRQTAQADTELDPITGRPKLKKQTQEIPKLEPNGNATWNNSWEIENSKSYGRFRQVDPSYTVNDYARVYNAMDKDKNGKLKSAEIQSYLDAMSGVDEAYRWAMFNAFANQGWGNPYKK
ncbi:MAG: hypothetical protein IKH75_14320 [Ruminococcus sp.]|nr:hypothetical protein [Ruminococcus sp.]